MKFTPVYKRNLARAMITSFPAFISYIMPKNLHYFIT